ncbi:MAG: hypothetical protein J6J86_07810 [Lachnospiraceae bacterium]|nr:hypothetical protein [Lachnospiraceae bacterium]
MENIHQIYDKIFKKILTLSEGAVVNLINGLFDTNYPPDSTVQYNWTEFEDNGLKKTLADAIITINGCHSYHMEAQIMKDEDIIFRVFEYGFSHASRNRIQEVDREMLDFPEPRIIYFYATSGIPDEYELRLNFGAQGYFDYKIPVLKYMNTTPEELTQKKMIILIPFELMKLRDAIKKERSPENLEALKNLIQNDILYSINMNMELGNITLSDAQKLKRLTHQLYKHIYAHYEEMEVLNEMTDESLILDIDIIEKRHEEELAKVVAEKDKELAEAVAEKDKEIELLKQQLADLQHV